MSITLSKSEEINKLSLMAHTLLDLGKQTAKHLGNKTYLPLGLDISGTKCLVVGGGRIALRKTNSLLRAGAIVRIVAPKVAYDIGLLIDEGRVEWIEDRYNSSYIYDCDIVISATSDRKLNIIIGREAKSAGKLHCVASSAKDSNLIFPAVCNHNDVIVAVHSNGRNCTKSKYTRNTIADFLAKKQTAELLVVGIYYKDITSEAANALDEIAKNYAEEIYKDEILFITTCQRWECYIYSDNPDKIFRKITEIARETFDIRFTDFSRCLYSKKGSAAFHHLIRLYTGLDSVLLGESDIANQISSATKKWLTDKSDLKSIFNLAAAKSKKIRKSSHLAATKTTWQSAIVSFLKDKLISGIDAKIKIHGNSKLAKSVSNRLRAEIGDALDYSEAEEAKILVFCDDKSFREFDFADLKGKDIIVVNLSRHNLPLSLKYDFEIFNLLDIADLSVTAENALKKAKAEIQSFEQSLIWQSATSNIEAPSRQIRIGARDSDLSRLQVEEISHFLSALSCQAKPCIQFYGSPGDRDKTTPLAQVSQQDFFTQDLDAALMAYEIDLAVHSAKDLPQQLHQSLHIAAITPSLAPWDCLVSRDGSPLEKLPSGSTIGTSSPRRGKQILRLRDDVEIADIRGNIPDRIAQLDSGKYDAIVVASVAMIRLGLSHRISEIFPLSVFSVEAAQGSLAIITRKNDNVLNRFLQPLNMGKWREE